MKALFILPLALSLVVISCKKKTKDPEPETTKTTTVAGDYQEAYSQYLTYSCPNNQLTNTSNKIYITSQGSADSRIRFNQGKVYAVSGPVQNELGKYTEEYVIFNTNPNDTFFVISQSTTELVTQTKHPTPCQGHTSIRYTFEI